jgi:hydrogenase expression/formation protein HypE
MPTDPINTDRFAMNCPAPTRDTSQILLAHGEGGRLSRQLIRNEILRPLANPVLQSLSDAAVLNDLGGRAVFTCDSYVVTPLFFPGGDIGRLAVFGAVNDLAVSGAEPLFLTLGLIVEEGLPISTLRQVVSSVREAANNCEVQIVAGDTKVVPRGAADQLFLHVAGLGRLRDGVGLAPHLVQAGDCILVSGTLGDHGIAILTAREGFDFEGDIVSDSASVFDLVTALLENHIDVRWMRDPTRGGVAAILHELVESAQITVELDEPALPVTPVVRGACELLGLDPLQVANEGKVLAVVSAADADRAIEIWRRMPNGSCAAMIGRVCDAARPEVVIRSALGVVRVLDEPAGAPLPRIC